MLIQVIMINSNRKANNHCNIKEKIGKEKGDEGSREGRERNIRRRRRKIQLRH